MGSNQAASCDEASPLLQPLVSTSTMTTTASISNPTSTSSRNAETCSNVLQEARSRILTTRVGVRRRQSLSSSQPRQPVTSRKTVQTHVHWTSEEDELLLYLRDVAQPGWALLAATYFLSFPVGAVKRRYRSLRMQTKKSENRRAPGVTKCSRPNMDRKLHAASITGSIDRLPMRADGNPGTTLHSYSFPENA